MDTAWQTDGILSPCWDDRGESSAPVPSYNAHGMANAGDRHPLLCRSGGQQRAGSAEENMLEFPFGHLPQDIAAQNDGTAATTGSTGVDVLFFHIINHGAAVIIYATDADTVPAE